MIQKYKALKTCVIGQSGSSISIVKDSNYYFEMEFAKGYPAELEVLAYGSQDNLFSWVDVEDATSDVFTLTNIAGAYKFTLALTVTDDMPTGGTVNVKLVEGNGNILDSETINIGVLSDTTENILITANRKFYNENLVLTVSTPTMGENPYTIVGKVKIEADSSNVNFSNRDGYNRFVEVVTPALSVTIPT
jgi:hypothetical protein